jgi:hypothetical protein
MKFMGVVAIIPGLIPSPVRVKARALLAKLFRRPAAETERAAELAPEPVPLDPDPDPAALALLAEMQDELHAQRAQAAELKRSVEENLQQARHYARGNALMRSLDRFTFVSPAAKIMTIDALEPLVKHSEDGAIVGGENVPLDIFVKDFLHDRAFLVAAR